MMMILFLSVIIILSSIRYTEAYYEHYEPESFHQSSDVFTNIFFLMDTTGCNRNTHILFFNYVQYESQVRGKDQKYLGGLMEFELWVLEFQTCSLDPFWCTNCPTLFPDLTATNFSCGMCQWDTYTRHSLPHPEFANHNSGQDTRYSREQYLVSGAVSHTWQRNTEWGIHLSTQW